MTLCSGHMGQPAPELPETLTQYTILIVLIFLTSTANLPSHASQSLILRRTRRKTAEIKHEEPEDKNAHFLHARLILDLVRRPLVNHWSPLTHASHCVTTSGPAAGTLRRALVRRPLVNHWSPLTHASHCVTTSWPAAGTLRRALVRRSLVNHWSPLTHASHCVTTSRPAAGTLRRRATASPAMMSVCQMHYL